MLYDVWVNFYSCKWPNIEEIIWPSGHTGFRSLSLSLSVSLSLWDSVSLYHSLVYILNPLYLSLNFSHSFSNMSSIPDTWYLSRKTGSNKISPTSTTTSQYQPKLATSIPVDILVTLDLTYVSYFIKISQRKCTWQMFTLMWFGSYIIYLYTYFLHNGTVVKMCLATKRSRVLSVVPAADPLQCWPELNCILISLANKESWKFLGTFLVSASLSLSFSFCWEHLFPFSTFLSLSHWLSLSLTLPTIPFPVQIYI